jgi:hypothetical protein
MGFPLEKFPGNPSERIGWVDDEENWKKDALASDRSRRLP